MLNEQHTCSGPLRMLYTRLPEGMAMPLHTAKPTMAVMLSRPAAAISIEGMTAHIQGLSSCQRTSGLPGAAASRLVQIEQVGG